MGLCPAGRNCRLRFERRGCLPDPGLQRLNSDNFFEDLAPFNNFTDGAFDSAHYAQVPPDWLLVVADIVQSTRAVDAGKYTEVNYVGAACIVAVTNALPGLRFPNAFGGDGATLAIPGNARGAVTAALLATKAWAQASFGLGLRVGMVPVSELLRRDAPLLVAKLELSPGNEMTMFRGAGFDLADRLVKDGDNGQSFQPEDSDDVDAMPDLESLSCRWSPMPSQNGSMVCLIIGARAGDIQSTDKVYRTVLARINRIANVGSVETCPVKLANLRFRLRAEGIIKEAKSRSRWAWLHLLPVALWHLFIWVLLRWRIPVGKFEPELYRQELTVNCDYRKVNGMLRLILDCTVEQADAIEVYLTECHGRGELVFGMHRASQAIMTCVAPDIGNHRHVHYIDGSEGGLWSAAKGLKAQIKALP